MKCGRSNGWESAPVYIAISGLTPWGPVTAGLVSAVAGVLLSLGYHGQLLKTLSPEVWQRLSDWFS